MEENKTIFSYLGQIFATFGVIVVIFLVFALVIGNDTSEYSTLFALGSKGLTAATLLEVLLLSVIITLAQVAFLTDKWIKNMGLAVRYVCFFGIIGIVSLTFSVLFSWFPIDNPMAWLGFVISFAICTAIGVVISKLEEKAENKKMEQALKKFNEE